MGKLRPMRPTRKQKEIMKDKNLVPNNWLVLSEAEGTLKIVHKKTSSMRQLQI